MRWLAQERETTFTFQLETFDLTKMFTHDSVSFNYAVKTRASNDLALALSFG